MALTAVWQTGILGGFSYLFLVKLVPYMTRFDSLHAVSDEEKELMRAKLWGFFSKAKKWPDHPVRFMLSYTMKGVAFMVLFGVLAALLTSVGWHNPLSWDGLYYDLIFARTSNELNSAHIVSYLPIPVLGLWVGWKFRTGDGMLNSYLGMLVAVFGVAVHEGEYVAGYYIFYPPTSWALIYNVMADVFFMVMLLIFYLTYVRFPFQRVPLSTYRWPVVGLTSYYVAWAVLFHYRVSTVNNFLIGHTQFNISQWYYDPVVNAIEVLSWVSWYLLLWLAIRRIPT